MVTHVSDELIQKIHDKTLLTSATVYIFFIITAMHCGIYASVVVSAWSHTVLATKQLVQSFRRSSELSNKSHFVAVNFGLRGKI